MTLSRRALLAGLMSCAAVPAFATAPQTSLRPRKRPTPPSPGARPRQAALRDVVAGAEVSGKHSIVVMDVNSGKVLEGLNPQTGLPPASVTKIATALYGIHHLGSDYRFTTQVLATGAIRNGTLAGDLILRGGGDPHLDSDDLNDLVAQLRRRGLKKVEGRFLFHDTALPHLDQIDRLQPVQVGYNPAISGLNLNFNRVHFEWKRTEAGYAVTMDARTRKVLPPVRRVKMRIVDRAGPLYAHKIDARGESWSVMRSALGRGGTRWLPVRAPGPYTAEVFGTLAAAGGIHMPSPRAVRGAVKGQVLAQTQSAALAPALRAMLRHSTNLTAEAIGLTTSRQRGAVVRSLTGSGKEMSAWLARAYGTRGTLFLDHSGLGDGSRVSAQQMATLLKGASNGPLRALLREYKVARAAKSKETIPNASVSAKTGTLNFVSALSGYLTCPNGRVLAFAILSADVPRRKRLTKAERERPPGGRTWKSRARGLQQDLLRRWVAAYG